jgi:ABC-type lipoprotein release transport system permease subunit
MDDLFGLSMTTIMLVLLGLLAFSFCVIGYVILRYRLMFLMGLRNIPRRPAQTVLIIIGLMLSTLIIAAAFTTGDTVDYSITSRSYSLLGHTDEVILRAGEEGAPIEISSTIPQEAQDTIREAVQARNDPNIDGFLPILFEPVPVLNPESRQSEPLLTFTGLDAGSTDGFPDIISTTTGEQLDIAALGPDEVYLNESAADKLDTEPGDVVQVFIQNQPYDFTVVDVVQDTFITGVGDFGETQGLVTRLDTLQEVFQQPGEVSVIAISNSGGVRDSVGLTEDVVATLEDVLLTEGFAAPDGPENAAAVALEVDDTKRMLVDNAEEAGNFMATFFIIFGLFSIASGVLLIVMIFVMLAAERKSEMGMARAIGTQRNHLVQMFMSEGMAYNVLAAMVGAGLGVLVAFGIAEIMARIFSEFGLSITPHVTARSLAISYSLGVTLTFLTVTFSSWRVSKLNIVAAIRNLPERDDASRSRNWRVFLRGTLNASLTCYAAAGIIGAPLFAAEAGLVALALAAFGLIAAVALLARRRDGREVGVWPLLAGTLVPLIGAIVVFIEGRDRQTAWFAGFATVGLFLGAALMLLGTGSNLAFPFALGFSLIVGGASVLLRFLGVRERPVFTIAGVGLLVFWGLTAGQRLEPIFGQLDGDVEMFFLSGIAMVTASTVVLLHNSDLVLAVVSRAGGLISGVLPAVRTAVAYPLAYKFRTGMTLAMISLVVFALTMMSTMNVNFDRLFLTDEARGGWDVVALENANNPIVNLTLSLRDEGSSAPGEFRAAGKLGFAGESSVRNDEPDEEFDEYPVQSVDDGFVDGGRIKLSARATGYESDEAVWAALKDDRNVAIVDGFTVQEGGINFDDVTFRLDGVDADQEEFDPVRIGLRDPFSGQQEVVDVIGVIDFASSQSFFGVFVPQPVFARVFGPPEVSQHFVSLNDPGQAKDVAQEIEATLLARGVQAESLKQQVEDEQALSRNFFRLMQAFMGLGLFVGIAAVGVVAFRTVVERRQQIGMLRAIGYQRGTVALSFVLESSFITLLAILSGVGLAIWLSYFLLTSDEFPSDTASFYIPWGQIAFIGLFTYGASLLMTFIPSRQAANVPVAEALRYE